MPNTTHPLPRPIVDYTGPNEDFPHDPLAVRKALETIDIRMLNRPLTLVQHRLYNVWVAFAQAVGLPDPNTRIFKFPLNEVIDLVSGEATRNDKHYEEAALSMMGLEVRYDALSRAAGAGPERSPNLELEPTDARPKKGGRRRRSNGMDVEVSTLVSYVKIDYARREFHIEFPEKILERILRPTHYADLLLLKQNEFKTNAALNLYEYSLGFADAGWTPWLPWQEYSMTLSGSPEPHKTYREFSKLLQRAIEIVNEKHDLYVVQAHVKRKGARLVDKMAIQITSKHRLAEGEYREPSSEVMAAMANLGMDPETVRTLAKRYPEGYVVAAVNYTRRQMLQKQRKGETMKVPAAYLRTALQANWAGWQAGQSQLPFAQTPTPTSAEGEGARTPANPADQGAPLNAVDEDQRAANAAVEAWLAAQELPRREALAQEWTRKERVRPLLKAYERDGFNSPLARQGFYDWIQKQSFYAPLSSNVSPSS